MLCSCVDVTLWRVDHDNTELGSCIQVDIVDALPRHNVNALQEERLPYDLRHLLLQLHAAFCQLLIARQ